MKISKTKIYLAVYLFFAALTFLGAAYVLLNDGRVNAGFAVVPMTIGLVFWQLYNRSKNVK